MFLRLTNSGDGAAPLSYCDKYPILSMEMTNRVLPELTFAPLMERIYQGTATSVLFGRMWVVLKRTGVLDI